MEDHWEGLFTKKTFGKIIFHRRPGEGRLYIEESERPFFIEDLEEVFPY